ASRVKTVLYPFENINNKFLEETLDYCNVVCDAFRHPYTAVRVYCNFYGGHTHYAVGNCILTEADKEALKHFSQAVVVCDCDHDGVKRHWTPNCTYDY